MLQGHLRLQWVLLPPCPGTWKNATWCLWLSLGIHVLTRPSPPESWLRSLTFSVCALCIRGHLWGITPSGAEGRWSWVSGISLKKRASDSRPWYCGYHFKPFCISTFAGVFLGFHRVRNDKIVWTYKEKCVGTYWCLVKMHWVSFGGSGLCAIYTKMVFINWKSQYTMQTRLTVRSLCGDGGPYLLSSCLRSTGRCLGNCHWTSTSRNLDGIKALLSDEPITSSLWRIPGTFC